MCEWVSSLRLDGSAMVRGRRRSGGLAARIVHVTLAIGAVTVLAAVSVALVGTFKLASSLIETRDSMVLQTIEDDVLIRFAAVEMLAAHASSTVATARPSTSVAADIAPLFDSADGIVDSLSIIDHHGATLVSLSRPVGSQVETSVYGQALRGVTGFSRVRSRDGMWRLWLTRAVVTRSGVSSIVVLRVNTDFLLGTVRKKAVESMRSVFVVENGRALVSAGAVSPGDLSRARWVAQTPGTGTIEIPGTAIGDAIGHYNDIEGIDGVSWRLVALGPATAAATETTIALIPGLAVLLLGGALSLFAAWLIARRLVEPLGALEVAAYSAAAGAYVKPLTTERDDEIGQVAHAFNAVALRLNALHDLSQLLASSSQLDQVLDGILSAMGHIVGPTVAVIYLVDESGRWLVPTRSRGIDVTQVSAVDSTSAGWLAKSLGDCDPVVLSADNERLTAEFPGLVDEETSLLLAPLVAGHEALGVVVVLRTTGAEISDAEREMLRTFSAQAAVAVQNSRLFEVESESRRIAEGLRAIVETLVRPRGLQVALHDSEKVIADLLGASSASFAILDRAALSLLPAPDRAQEAEVVEMALRVLAPSGLRRPAVARVGDDAVADRLMAAAGSGELFVVPVAVESGHGAILIVTMLHETIGRRDIELAQAIANELTLALDNAYLYGRAVSHANNLETVFRISQAVGSSLQLNVVLNRVLDVVQKILSADAVALMTFDTRRRILSTVMARGSVSPDLVGRQFASGDDVPGYVFASGEPAAYRDLREDMGGIAGDAAVHGLHSLLAVPLLTRGRSIGVLTVFSAEGGAFPEEDVNMLRTFAAQAALAIDTARLYGHEHEVAEILQHSILPDALAEFSEIEAGSVYRPAGGESEIGGDYYDLFRAFDQSLWLVIADVCGQGVIAATKTSMIKFAVRSFVAAGLAPGAVLSAVNDMVVDSGDVSDIVTLWAGRYDPAQALLTWAGGGHLPALLLRRGEATVIRLASTGPLLGALAHVPYSQESTPLTCGDSVLLYTDGVTEARSGNTFFGEDRLAEIMLKGSSSTELAETILDSVRRFTQGDLRDDVAVLAVKVRIPDEDDG